MKKILGLILVIISSQGLFQSQLYYAKGLESIFLTLHGKNNCINLDQTNAAKKYLSKGTYTISCTGEAYYKDSKSFESVILRYYSSTEGRNKDQILKFGSTITLELNSYNIYAYFTDINNVNDNSGQVILSINGEELIVDGKLNCINLNNTTAASLTLEKGTYNISVSGDAFYGGTASLGGFLLRYLGSDEIYYNEIIRFGENITIDMGAHNIYAFFADWSNINDNTGQIVVEFKSDFINQTNEPIAFYPFNGNSNDESGKGNHGAVSGAILTVDRFGNPNSAYRFDGNDRIITQANNQLDNYSIGSVSFWISPNNVASDLVQTVLSYSTTSSLKSEYHFSLYKKHITVSYKYGGDFKTPVIEADADLEDNKWYNIVVSADGSNRIEIYINGEKQTTSFNSFETLASGSEWFAGFNGVHSYDHFVGIGYVNNESYFNGIIDDIAIYNSFLSQSEIEKLFHERGWTDISELKVKFPNGGEILNNNSPVKIKWDAKINNPVNIYFSKNGGLNWLKLKENWLDINNAFNWLPYNIESNECKVMIEDTENESIVDQSDKNFELRSEDIISKEFVSVQNGRFYLKGKKFNFIGTNAYWLQNKYANGRKEIVNEFFEQCANKGITVVRTWGFADSSSKWENPNDPAIIQNKPILEDGQLIVNLRNEGLEALDYIIAQAGINHIKLNICLLNNHKDYGGIKAYLEWTKDLFNIDTSHVDFFKNNIMREMFSNYIDGILNRKNTISGIIYKNDPTIFGWEIINEPRAPGIGETNTINQWLDDISSYINSKDNIHLISVGEEGFDDNSWGYEKLIYNISQEYFFGGQEGISFTKNLYIENIDFSNIHLYPELWKWNDGKINKNYDWLGAQWIESHALKSAGVNKPLVIGEFGIAIDNPNIETIYDEWMKIHVELKDKINGSFVWQYVPSGMIPHGEEGAEVDTFSFSSIRNDLNNPNGIGTKIIDKIISFINPFTGNPITTSFATISANEKEEAFFEEVNLTFNGNVSKGGNVIVNYYDTSTENFNDIFSKSKSISASNDDTIKVISKYFWEIISDEVDFTNGEISINIENLSGVKNANNLVWLSKTQTDSSWKSIGAKFNGNILINNDQFNKFSLYAIGSLNDENILPVEDHSVEIAFDLMQNFPNPFNPKTTISYSIPQNDYVTLKIFDVLGCEVKTLIDEQMLKGNYRIELNASSISSGIYFYRLKAGDYVETKKMILLK